MSCRCTQQKFRDAGVDFYSETKLYQDIKDVYVGPCPQHPLFKERFRNTNVDLSCRCLEQGRVPCSNWKTCCFTLNFVADKIKVYLCLLYLIVFNWKQLKDIWKKDIISMLFSYFCKSCSKIVCSLDNPIEYDLIRGKEMWGN